MAEERYNLQRFLDAQELTYAVACAELALGRKRTHWMWFIFPQIKGLGSSPTAQRFAISTLEEGAAYLEHPVLGARLVHCTTLVNDLQERSDLHERSIKEVFEYPDNLKFHSSMTLFARVVESSRAGASVFQLALERYFAGLMNHDTLERL